ncbi:MAG: hypothetical protein QGH20_06215 [Candidatus Latescibacteria bacterium]|jgi:ActR/RegA family two-component response regulator|nr:hypothetical protein [Candidatus Latescibacterota bacterium]
MGAKDIVVVDEEHMWQLLLTRALNRCGLSVEVATTAPDADLNAGVDDGS